MASICNLNVFWKGIYYMITDIYNDERAAKALVKILGNSRWHAVAFAYGYLAMVNGTSDDSVAQIIRLHSDITLRSAKEFIQQSKEQGFLSLLQKRDRKGSAENPITKLFPATVTEQRFLELLDDLCNARSGLSYTDDRHSRYTLADFKLCEGEDVLPINIKNAGTRFEQAKQLVKLEPDDCIPIPAYKANAAVETMPNLLYNVSVDFHLVNILNKLLSQILTSDETIVWDILGTYKGGSHVKSAEDEFVFGTVHKHWDAFKQVVNNNPFHVISARKSVYILQSKPYRTPGIGLKWGTGASAEVNVHVSITEDTIPWMVVSDRIKLNGIVDIINAVNRKLVKEIYVPEI